MNDSVSHYFNHLKSIIPISTMTKVNLYPQKTIPIILINDQELSTFDLTSRVNSVTIHNTAANFNAQRTNDQENFCEFKRTGEIPSRYCYHITCLYKRGTAKNSIIGRVSDRNSENQECVASNALLSTEKSVHYEKAQKRWHRYLAILRNDNIELSWFKLFLYTLGIVFLGVLSTIPMTLVPGHDLVKCPEYWYEILYHATLSTIGVCSLMCYLSGYFLNVNYTMKLRNVAIIFLITVVFANSIVIASYYIWTSILMHQYPIPFQGRALMDIIRPVFLLLIWFKFPKEWRSDDGFRKRMKYLSFFWVIIMLTVIVFVVVINAIKQYQTIAVFASIAIREMFLWIQSKIIQNTSDADFIGANTALKYYTYAGYSMLSCYFLATKLSSVASWILIVADFLINILKCFRLVWTIKQCPIRKMDQLDYLQDLVLCELIEFQAPLSYILAFVCTYFGPNGHLFGNVLNGYWNFIRTEDIYQKLYKWTLYFLVDFSSMIVTAISLWYAFKINVFKALLDLQQEFLPVFIVVLGSLLNLVS